MKVGHIQTLKVNRISDYGLYLIDDEEQEVLLPNRYFSLDNKVGDEIEVFVYHDSEDRLVATTDKPLIIYYYPGKDPCNSGGMYTVKKEYLKSSKQLFLAALYTPVIN